MSTNFELGRISYNNEHRSGDAVSRLIDEKMIANMLAALNNPYISAALTKENKELIASVVSSHISLKSKIVALKHTELKGTISKTSPSVLMGQLFYHHENDEAIALSKLADEELIGNMISLLSNENVSVLLSKEDFDRTIKSVVSHVTLKASIVRTRQDELIARNDRVGYSI